MTLDSIANSVHSLLEAAESKFLWQMLSANGDGY